MTEEGPPLVTLDSLAFEAANKAVRNHQQYADTADQSTANEVRIALETYIALVAVTETTHKLRVIKGGVPGYEPLARILEMAYDQSATGKGRERHGRGRAFTEQPIFNISRMVGLGGLTYQICKKAQEATNMDNDGNIRAAHAELLGAIVYAAAAVLLIEEANPRTFEK